MASRPLSSMRARPPSSGLSTRPPLASRMGTGPVPGTGRPGTRGGVAGMPSSVMTAGIKVADRPMTQQGLGGMKTASQGPQRQIQDRTYWIGEIRSKTSEMTTEIRKVEGEIQHYQEENNTYLMFEKRAETLAAEIADLQGQLHDYNMMIDRVNMNQEIEDMADDLNALKIRNDREEESLTRIFDQRQNIEEKIEKMEAEIQHEKAMTENRVQDMPSNMREKYKNLKKESLQNAEHVEKLQGELDSITSKQQQIEQSLQSNQIKLEAVRLNEQLSELQMKYEQLQKEEEKYSSPEDEKDQLLAKVKSNNQGIATTERQLKEIEETMNNLQEELQQLESALEDQEDENAEKYRQLQKKEQAMEDFLTTFDETKSKELDNMEQLEQSNVAVLEQISHTITSSENLPSVKEMKAMQEDLHLKEGELQKAQSTSMSLTGENARLQQDLSKIEQLADKIGSEMVAIREKNEQMTRDLEKFRDIDRLNMEAEQKKNDLLQEKEELGRKKDDFKHTLEEMTAKYEQLHQQLEENETHMQLNNLLRKWQHLEQTNFALAEYIKSKSLDYKPVAIRVEKKLAQLNKHLQEVYAKSPLT